MPRGSANCERSRPSSPARSSSRGRRALPRSGRRRRPTPANSRARRRKRQSPRARRASRPRPAGSADRPGRRAAQAPPRARSAEAKRGGDWRRGETRRRIVLSARPSRKRAHRRRREGGGPASSTRSAASFACPSGGSARAALSMGTISPIGVKSSLGLANRVRLGAPSPGGASGVEHRNQRARVADFAQKRRRLRRQERKPGAAVGWGGSDFAAARLAASATATPPTDNQARCFRRPNARMLNSAAWRAPSPSRLRLTPCKTIASGIAARQ